MACVICSSVGLGVLASRAAADMIWPVWQYPHCGTSSSIHACCKTCRPLAPRPSMVMMLFPETCETGVEQERIGAPSTCTVQAPHKPAPHPNFVPVSSSVSRRTQSKGVSGETLTFFSLPFTRSVTSAMLVQSRLSSLVCDLDNHRTEPAGKWEWERALVVS